MPKKREGRPDSDSFEQVVVIKHGEPGYATAKDIAEHGRICRQLSCCSCKPEDRNACFDWVKV